MADVFFNKCLRNDEGDGAGLRIIFRLSHLPRSGKMIQLWLGKIVKCKGCIKFEEKMYKAVIRSFRGCAIRHDDKANSRLIRRRIRVTAGIHIMQKQIDDETKE